MTIKGSLNLLPSKRRQKSYIEKALSFSEVAFFKISVNSLEDLICWGSSCFELAEKLLLLVMTFVIPAAANEINKNLAVAAPTLGWG